MIDKLVWKRIERESVLDLVVPWFIDKSYVLMPLRDRDEERKWT